MGGGDNAIEMAGKWLMTRRRSRRAGVQNDREENGFGGRSGIQRRCD